MLSHAGNSARRIHPRKHGQTISQPYITARTAELLEPRGDERVLDVGTGSGFHAALLGMLAREVISIERIPELAAVAVETSRWFVGLVRWARAITRLSLLFQ